MDNSFPTYVETTIYVDPELRCTIHADRIYTPGGNFETSTLVGAHIEKKDHVAKTVSVILGLGSFLAFLIGICYRSSEYNGNWIFWLFCIISTALFFMSRMLKHFDYEYKVDVSVFNNESPINKKFTIVTSDSRIQAERLVNVLNYTIHIAHGAGLIEPPYIPFRHKYDELLCSFLKWS